MKQAAIFIFLLALLISSCHKESASTLGNGSVIIIDQGNFQHGNADLSVYNPTTKTVSNRVFSTENGFAMGDVAQSLFLLNDTAYIVMNNSQNIVIADAKNNFKYIDTILLPGSSPRYFLPVGGSKAYITELYANKIWVVDFRKRTLLKTISVNGWTEQLISWGGNVYVQEATTPYLGTGTQWPPVHAILMINPSTDQIVNSVALQSDPGGMALTAQNKLFVLSPQDTPTNNAGLYEIDIASFSIQRQMNFSPSRTPNYLTYSPVSNQIMFNDAGGIFAMLPTDTTIPTSPYITSPGWAVVYGLNVNPSNGDIYVCDAVDYQQQSHIWRYSHSGSLVDHFTAGIISSGCVFE